MLNIDAIRMFLINAHLPTFVHEVSARPDSFNKCAGVTKDYTLLVRLARDEYDPYNDRTKRPISNHAFDFPRNQDELRAQVVSAVLMAVAHETIEQVSDGGDHWCDPHAFKGGSPEDTAQWMGLLSSIRAVVDNYATLMPGKEVT